MQRKFQMTRIEPGDYLVPSNDATTLWRLQRYEEDGSLETDEGVPVRGTFWRALRFRGTIAQAEKLLHSDPEEFLWSNCWDEWRSLLPTRKSAEEFMLSAEHPDEMMIRAEQIAPALREP